MWNHGKPPEDGAETHNQRKAFALAFGTFRVWPVVGRRRRRRRCRRRGRYARGWVSGADVKLLFGHPSDRKPRRLPVSVTSVRGRRPRRRLQATFHFISAEILSTCLPYFLIFFLWAAVWPRLGVCDSSGEASRRSDVGLGRSSDAR